MLWCDGVRHCPSGYDEREENCAYRFGVTLLYVAVGTGALGIFLILLLATGCLKYCLYRRRQRLRRQKKLSQSSPSSGQDGPQVTPSPTLDKVQVLNVKQLNAPTSGNHHHQRPPQHHQQYHHGTLPRNNGVDGDRHHQPRYANAVFGKQYGTLTYHPHHQQQQKHFRWQDEMVGEQFSKDSIC